MLPLPRGRTCDGHGVCWWELERLLLLLGGQSRAALAALVLVVEHKSTLLTNAKMEERNRPVAFDLKVEEPG